MTTIRSTVFIGSSVEGLSIAKAIQQNLDRVAQCVIWSQGVFGLTGGTLENLVAKLELFDFAILVLTPDDMILNRDEAKPCARDNVLFEFGLFVGGIGRERTFGVYDRQSGLQLPSDLAGITLANFECHADGNLQASLGAASTLIETAISAQGVRPRFDMGALTTPEQQFQIIADLLDASTFQFLILLKDNDSGIDRDWRTKFEYSGYKTFSNGHGNGFAYVNLAEKLPDAGILKIDLRNKISLSNRGRQFVSWLLENDCKAGYFSSDFGGWGLKPDESK